MPFFFRTRDIFVVGILLVVVTAWFSLGYHHPDEHYQIWEFAKYKLGESPLEDLPWEYAEKMRPGLQPFMAFGLILSARFAGIEDPFVQVILMRLLSGLLAFWLYWKWCDALAPTLSDNGRLLRLCLAFFWIMPYLNVRFSSENMSAIAFLGGLLLVYPQPQQASAKNLIGAGLLLCLSFFFRYQIAFAGIGAGAWLLVANKLSIRNWSLLIVGGLLGIGVGVLADHWLYGEWVLAPYHYFTQNIVHDRAAGFGVSPWWWYITEMPVFLLPPLSLFLFWFMGKGIRRAPWHVFVWSLVPFFVLHSVVDHKESRFLLPMIFPVFYLAALGWDTFREKKALPKWLNGVLIFGLVLNVLILVGRCVYPANDHLTYLRFIRKYSMEHPEAVTFLEKKHRNKKETLNPHFFQTPWIKMEVTDSLAQLNDTSLYRPKTGDLIHFRSLNTSFAPNGFQTECVYKWFPDWFLRFNPNGWQERTRIWSVYRLEKINQFPN